MSVVRRLAKSAFTASDRLQPAPKGPRVLIYHRVGRFLGQQMEVTEDDFAWQSDWLASNREVVPLDEALKRWTDEDSSGLVAITIDDGYEDTFTEAFPILMERRLPFTLYVSTEHVETGVPLNAETGAPPLTWDQIREMLDSGLMTLGAHTHSHPDLRNIDPDDIETELRTSDELIEQRTGVKPIHFAYPWGYWSGAAEQLVAERYQSAVLGSPFSAKHEFHPLLVHRYPVQLSDGRRFFEARLRGGMLLEERIRRRLRGYEGP